MSYADRFDAVPSIPEPQTYAMLLAGLGVLGFMARRRKETTI
ncbi:MAG: FxDxF family PEP-CTERM protein [Nitrosomonas sp.]